MWDTSEEWLAHIEALKMICSICNTFQRKDEVCNELWKAYLESLDRVKIEVLAEDEQERIWRVVGGTEPAHTFAHTLSLFEEEKIVLESFRGHLNRRFPNLREK